MGLDQLTFLFQWQFAAMVSQRVNHDSCILAGFDNFIQVADRTDACCYRQRAVLPLGAVDIEQEAADEVGCCHVFVTGYRDQRLLQLPRPVLDETGLSATGRALQHDRHTCVIGGLVHIHLVLYGAVVGFFRD